MRKARDAGLPEMRPDLDPGGERSAYFPLIYIGPLGEANKKLTERLCQPADCTIRIVKVLRLEAEDLAIGSWGNAIAVPIASGIYGERNCLLRKIFVPLAQIKYVFNCLEALPVLQRKELMHAELLAVCRERVGDRAASVRALVVTPKVGRQVKAEPRFNFREIGISKRRRRICELRHWH